MAAATKTKAKPSEFVEIERTHAGHANQDPSGVLNLHLVDEPIRFDGSGRAVIARETWEKRIEPVDKTNNQLALVGDAPDATMTSFQQARVDANIEGQRGYWRKELQTAEHRHNQAAEALDAAKERVDTAKGWVKKLKA